MLGFSLLITSAGLATLPGVTGLGRTIQAEHAPIEFQSLDARSAVFAADGSLIAFLSEEQNREPVALETIPQDVINAILASEDENFYDHNGISPTGIVRAAFNNLENSGGSLQGGSTITQQLVKNAVLGDFSQSFERKLEEAYLAVQLEQELSKDEILERYLNTVFFGSGAYGVEVAAETYWGYDGARELTKCDAALLASIIPNPVRFDPTRFPDTSEQRRAVVINRLVTAGVMDDVEAESCREEPLPIQRQAAFETRNYFTEEVQRLLLNDDANQFNLGEEQEDRFDAIFRSGLQIFTTINPEYQEAAEAAQENFAPRNPERFTTAISSIDTHTGAVRAIVGGPGFQVDNFNIATQGQQQPGSTMKTFVLAALFESGFVASDTVRADSPCTFQQPAGLPPYTVSSPGGSFRETIASVTRSSFNCPFVRLGQVVGNDTVVEVSQRLGISTLDEADGNLISLPLGVKELIPLEVAGAYAAFGNDGEFNKPYFIERIEDSQGNVIYEHTPNPTRAVSANTARQITEVLRTNVTRELGNGTGRRAQVVLEDGTEHVVAGKTGTTNDNVSAWFAGYTDYLTTVVWVGHPDGNITIDTDSLNRDAYNVEEYCCLNDAQGGTAAAPIFDFYNEIVHEGLEPAPFALPTNTESRSSRFLEVEEEQLPFCPNSIPQNLSALIGQAVDLDGDGLRDCLVPQVVPGAQGGPPVTIPGGAEVGGAEVEDAEAAPAETEPAAPATVVIPPPGEE